MEHFIIYSQLLARANGLIYEFMNMQSQVIANTKIVEEMMMMNIYR